jgi:RNA polymerase sigma-70 factor (ECF subfamily)
MAGQDDRTAAIRRGDPETLDQVVRSALPGLLRTALAAGLSPDRAEDIVQSSLLIFVRRAADYDGRASASTWIHGILLRKVWEDRRAQTRDAAYDDIDDVVESRFDLNGSWGRPPNGPIERLVRGELNDKLQSCLESLPDRHRVAFTLREIEGFKAVEVCKILEVSTNNLGVILFRARNRLRECLEAKGVRGVSDAEL